VDPGGPFRFIQKIGHYQKGWQNNQQDRRPANDQKLDKYVLSLKPFFHYFLTFKIKGTDIFQDRPVMIIPSG
jgi:hypothetical protein